MNWNDVCLKRKASIGMLNPEIQGGKADCRDKHTGNHQTSAVLIRMPSICNSWL